MPEDPGRLAGFAFRITGKHLDGQFIIIVLLDHLPEFLREIHPGPVGCGRPAGYKYFAKTVRGFPFLVTSEEGEAGFSPGVSSEYSPGRVSAYDLPDAGR